MKIQTFTYEQMSNMVNSYGSDQKIADAVGVTRQCIQQHRTALGIQPCKPASRRNNKILRLRKAGWLIWELADKFKISERQVKRIIKGAKDENA